MKQSKWTLGYFSRNSGDFTYHGIYNSPQEACAVAGMKSWVYDLNTDTYVPYDSAKHADVGRVECGNSVYAAANPYRVAFRLTEVKLVSQTLFTSPANRERTTIGVGESVTVTANLPVNWQIDGEIIKVDKISDNSLTFSALDKAGRVTIKAIALNKQHGESSLTFSIIQPSELKLLKLNEVHTKNILDSGFVAQFILLPAHVNFQNVYIRELESLAYGGTNLLEEGNGQPHGHYPSGYSEWFNSNAHQEGLGTILDEARTDFVYGGQNEFCPQSIPSSIIHLKIKYEWSLTPKKGEIHYLTTLQQTTSINQYGSVTVSKGNISVTFHYTHPSTNIEIIADRGAVPVPKHHC